MSEPFRLRALEALTAALEEIVIADGYKNDMSPFVVDGQEQHRVLRGRTIYGDGDPIPMISILEPPVPIEHISPEGSGDGNGDWDLIITGFVRDDPADPTAPAYRLLADVKRRLAIEKAKRTATHDPVMFGLASSGGKGNVIVGMRIGLGVVRPPDEVSDKAYFWLPLTFEIVEDMTNPFV